MDADKLEEQRQLGAAQAAGFARTTARYAFFGCLSVIVLLWGAWFILKSAAENVPAMRKAAREQINKDRDAKGMPPIDFESPDAPAPGHVAPD